LIATELSRIVAHNIKEPTVTILNNKYILKLLKGFLNWGASFFSVSAIILILPHPHLYGMTGEGDKCCFLIEFLVLLKFREKLI